jgi:hypothetical protein
MMSEDFEQRRKAGAYEVMLSWVMVEAASGRAFLDTKPPLLGTALALEARTRRVVIVVVMNFIVEDKLVVAVCKKIAWY